jgi:hypothetical protein
MCGLIPWRFLKSFKASDGGNRPNLTNLENDNLRSGLDWSGLMRSRSGRLKSLDVSFVVPDRSVTYRKSSFRANEADNSGIVGLA